MTLTVTTPPLITTPFASAGDQSVVPATDPNGFVNYNTGYTPDYEINLSSGDPDAKAVERGIQNYLFNILTNAMQAWQVSNRPPWYASMPGGYAQWAEVVYPNASGVPQPYRSLANNNVSTPGNSATWEYIQGSGEMIKNIPMPSGGAAGSGSMVITSATDFNSMTVSGTFQYATDAVTQGSGHYPVNGGNSAGAGMLEVSAWVDGSANAYITQMFRDRNGLGFMRGSINGSWTAWKIWANASQFVVGEVRKWYGTATEAAVVSAWGPGWHLCNGQNGTPNLTNQFIIGAGGTYANGATGGSTSVSLTSANIPSHNHVINISDNGHNHGISQTPHGHGVSDPGHSHGVYDPGHAHSNQAGGWVQAGQDNGGASAASAPNQYGTYSGLPILNTNGNGTGVAIYGNSTNISIQAQYANVANVAAITGITATSNNTGSGSAFTVVPPFVALTYVMYTGQ